MLDPSAFGKELEKRGFNFFSGVPCSYLKELINYAAYHTEYYMAANEGDAVAICSGAYLANRKSVVLMQNSGLSNAMSPLLSLNHPYRIPLLAFVGFRGDSDSKDEPQHELTGKISTSLLSLMNIEWEILDPSLEAAVRQLERANEAISQKRSFFLLVRKGTFLPLQLEAKKDLSSPGRLLITTDKELPEERPLRMAALEEILRWRNDQTFFFATTGFTSRELYELDDNPNNFYMVGSMGCVSSLSFGFAVARPDRDVIAIDGDGALLMRMGSLTTHGRYAPSNLLHIVLDNNAHESTGGQKTASHNVDFTSLASASGYPGALHAHNLQELHEYIGAWKKNKRLTFIWLRIASESKKALTRPKITPLELAERFKAVANH